ncbi:MAG: helix-turn-helix domain-containing protein [Deferribacterales bacterium]
MYQHVGHKLKSIRNKKGFTQPQIAAELGVTYQTYQYYERTGNIDAHKVSKLIKFLNISYDDLFNLDTEYYDTGAFRMVLSEKSFGQLLKDLLHAKHMTHEDLAKMEIGVKAIQIGHYVRGRNFPSLDVLQTIAEKLCVPVAYFFNEISLDDALKKSELDPDKLKQISRLLEIIKDLDNNGMDEIIKQAEKEKSLQDYKKIIPPSKKSS